ncbi:protein FAM83H [Myxocyprinus asiaticus]|uniref:protein FAM83H n=1 Tax=Myxocyprinus asiaticus TaxID=70543 RepID=UPI002221B462|nr:protein FAM83H [Myxocyprinus asiaticus]XP_051527344.1 protein FAM83H [Myxocyprinus asiaticus]
MAHRSQSSSVGDNPLDPNYLRPHYREEYRMAIDALVEEDLEGYYSFLQNANVVDFLSRPEIEHIKCTVRSPQSAGNVPELPYHEIDQDGSSDTYWPLHSDLDAPGLDLGWPLQQHCFVGPTEVTMLVNPSDPEMPSIKEQARRLIKNANQVIAVVMDIFTDVDIFSDLLDAAARHVPVYILLDEHNAHHFVSMVTCCKVNLDMIHMMRVRTVAGVTYFCRTGKSFKGQVMDRFLLTDCRAVLSGNYSFMWSFEKIHRCIAHLFLGELVATFDEEFRILFAQSQPLIVENALVPMPHDKTSSYLGNQFGLKRTQSLRNPRGFLRQPELTAYPFGDRVESILPFRRDDPFRHTLEPGAMQVTKYASQQFRMQQSFLDQGRSMLASRQMEMNAYKRHSYAEGTHETYASSRQYMKHRVMNNLEEMESQYQREQHYYQSEGIGPDPEHGRYDRLNYGLNQTDQYSDSAYATELEAPGNLNVLSSDDLRHGSEKQYHSGGGRYGLQSHKRPSVGHAYACQSSPTQPHPPDHKQLFPTGEQTRQSQDPSAKQGLRSWRINSYLSTYEDVGEEGLHQPMGPDAFDEPQQQPDRRPYYPEGPGSHFNTREPPNIPTKSNFDLWPRFSKPILQERNQVKDISSDLGPTGTDTLKPAISSSSLASSTDNEKEVEFKEPKEISITKHESFRTRINPMLQRSSRLRSSLIFSSSKLEQHSSSQAKSGGELQEEKEETEPIRYSSIVAEILEKRRSLSREPFDWSKHKKADEKDGINSSTVDLTTIQDTTNNKEEHVKEKEKPEGPVPVDQTKVTQPTEHDLNDPASRLEYFKELAAKRKSNLQLNVVPKSQQPSMVKTDLSNTQLSATATQVQYVSIISEESTAKIQDPSTAQTDPSATHPLIPAKPKPFEVCVDRPCTNSKTLTENTANAAKKEPAKELIVTKSHKPFSSANFFKKDILRPSKGSQTRRISCGEEIHTDATDAEKSELKKSRSLSSSGISRTESKESLSLTRQGSNASINLVGSEGKDTKALDFLKKQTQRLKGFLGPKGEKKNSGVSGSPEDKSMKTVTEVQEEPSDKGTHSESISSSTTVENKKPNSKSTQSRYQSSTSNVLFSSNLRDDTKVILEQISANSQKNRQELVKQSEESGKGEEDKEDTLRYQSHNRFSRSPVNPQERDNLLKRIESMRKEKKVYSRFEMGNNLG